MNCDSSKLQLSSGFTCRKWRRQGFVHPPVSKLSSHPSRTSTFKWYKWTYKTERGSDLENKLIVAGGWYIVREFGKVMYTLLYSKWITDKDLLCSTWNSARCCVPAWMGRGFVGEWIHVYVWLSPFTFPLKLPHIVNQLYPKTKGLKFGGTKRRSSLSHPFNQMVNPLGQGLRFSLISYSTCHSDL